MKKRNKIIALMLGTVMTVSMASTSMAATVKTAQTTKTQQTATETTTKADNKSDAKTTDSKKNDKKEEKKIFGKIKKIDKDIIELETAEQAKTNTKVDSKATVKKISDTEKTTDKNADKEKEEDVKLVLDGKTTKVTVEKDTRFVCEADKEDKADTKSKKTGSKEDTASAKTVKKNNTKNIEQEKEDKKAEAADETIKLADLRAGDIVKVTMNGDKVTEIKKLITAELEEKN